MTEHDHQKVFVAWARRNYPDLVLFAIPNGGIRDAITARKLKEEGVLTEEEYQKKRSELVNQL
jgi:hypothetical protein